MSPKRQLLKGGDGEADLPNKRRHLLSTIFKGMTSARTLQNYMPILESNIRKWVGEEVDRAVGTFLGSNDCQVGGSGSRTLQLQFLSDSPPTVFTGNKILSVDGNPIKFALFDSGSKELVASGPYSSILVDILVLGGDFPPDCREDWSKKDFDSKIARNREGKRPLVIGELTVPLQDGIGHIGDVSFTDNSRWTRSGTFRLGVRVHSGFDGARIREGVSNAFQVKDHRGESYKKHHPPFLNDEVWRLEKIAKEGTSHKQLTRIGIRCVGDFLRSYATNPRLLRDVFRNISDNKWKAIIKHATTCILDDKKYVYRTAQGTGLLFNSVYNVVEVTFDGRSYHSVDSLNSYQMKTVDELKQHAYGNLNSWEVYEAGPNMGADLHIGQGQLEMQMNAHHPTISLSHGEVGQDNSSFELGGSSQMQGLNPTFSNSFEMNDSPDGFYIGEETWASGGNHMDSQLPPQDFTGDENFEER